MGVQVADRDAWIPSIEVVSELRVWVGFPRKRVQGKKVEGEGVIPSEHLHNGEDLQRWRIRVQTSRRSPRRVYIVETVVEGVGR